MKHTLLFSCFLFAAVSLNAQSQRLVLIEEFTAEDCGPCAAVNPSFNQLIRDNAPKVVAIKYQGAIGNGNNNTLYQQNKSEVTTRENYYSINSSPTAVLDGNVMKKNAGQFKTSDINARYGDNSPFTLSVSHAFSTNSDSLTITVDVECTEDFTAGANTSLKLRLALIEKRIELAKAAPNGERVFEGAMRKMYPNASGTTLARLWTDGDIQSFTFKVLIPNYIYDKNELQLIAFIQDDQDKEVIQAAISQTQPVRIDGKLKNYSSAFMQCDASGFQPKVTIMNNGIDDLSSLDVSVKVKGVFAYTYNWFGNLKAGESEEVALPAISHSAGTSAIEVITSNPNSENDHNKRNDTLRSEFSFAVDAEPAPVLETFESGIPSKFAIENPGANTTWASGAYSAFGQGAKSAMLRFYAIGTGDEDYLYLPTLDLTPAEYARVNFDFAHALYGNNYNDQCDIEGSIDCGKTWITLWSKKGSALATKTGNVTAEFKPTDTEWKSDFASLDLFAGRTDILVRLKGVSDYGNNLYIDNINVEITATPNGGPTLPSSVGEIENSLKVNVYPNPANDVVRVDFSASVNIGSITVFNAQGVKVAQSEIAGQSLAEVAVHNLPSGVYQIVAVADGKTFRKPFVVVH